MSVPVKRLLDENRELFYPVTHIDAVRNSEGQTVRDLIEESGNLAVADVAEDGFFFVDENLNIGAYLDASGIHAPNILEYEIISD